MVDNQGEQVALSPCHLVTPSPRDVPVAIIGMGCLFPGAPGLDAYWSAILNKTDAIREVPPTHWSPEDYYNPDPKTPDHTYARRGGFLDPVPFPPLEFGITPNALEAIDSTQLLALLVAQSALEHAGYGAKGKPLDRRRVGVILGVTGTLPLVIPLGARLGHPHWRRALREAGVSEEVANEVMRRISEAYVGWQEDSFPGLLGNVVAGRIANRLNLGGTNCVVDAACASSLAAVHLALLELSTGRCDLVLTGGMDTFNDIFMYLCFSKTPALSPTGDARPFAADADGTILGEGLGCLVLKRRADAERDGDTIYAVIKGLGTSSDGKGSAIYAPSPAGQVRALRQAHALAGVTPDTIELIEAHGTGTRAGDRAEVQALVELFRFSIFEGGLRTEEESAIHPRKSTLENPPAAIPRCALGSVKSQIGHTKAAAGVAGLIKAALALHHKVLPPTLKVEQPLDLLQADDAPLYVNTDSRPWLRKADHPRRAGVSSFGFGGSNFHCILEEYGSEKSAITWDGRVQIAAFSGEQVEEVQQQALAWLDDRSWEELRAAAGETRARFDRRQPVRLTLVVEQFQSEAERETVRSELRTLSTAPRPGGRCYLASGPVPGQIALLFPGQGAQYPGMLRDLACRFPQMLESLQAGADAFQAQGAALLRGAEDKVKRQAPFRSLGDLIYPHSLFSDEQRQRAAERLRATEAAQPALGAICRGALEVLVHFGVQADAVAGHSFGELTALWAAGRLSTGSFHPLAALRGRLMAAETGDRGGMLAVQLDRQAVGNLIRQQGLDLVLANHNAPRQVVLSGSTEEIERAAAWFRSQAITVQRLPVAAAFHSPLVGGVRAAFHDHLQSTDLTPGRVPVYANITGQPYPDDPSAARELLARQLAEPVEFVTLVENLYTAGVRTLVEVGPGTILTGLVQNILGSRSHQALALDASGGRAPGQFDLARLLAALAALGYPVQLTRWDENFTHRPQKPTLTIPLCGANYRAPKVSRSPHETRNPRSESAVVAAQPVPPDRPKPMVPRQLSAGFQEALHLTQESLLALQRMNEQTAELHRRFLEGQDRALEVFHSLLQQQQALLLGQTPTVAALAPASTPPSPIRGEEAHRLAARHAERGPASQERGIGLTENPGNPASTPLPVSSSPSFNEHHAPATPPSPRKNHTASAAQSTLLAVVSEKTGYPVEMLELGMELDADLGIDSIKRVEIFSALQERLPAAPTLQAEHLGSLRTLRDVLDFLLSRHPEKSRPAAGQDRSEPADVRTILEVIAGKLGLLVDELEMGLELGVGVNIPPEKWADLRSALAQRFPHVTLPEPLPPLSELVQSLLGSNSTSLSKGKGEEPTPLVREGQKIEESPLLPDGDRDAADEGPLSLAFDRLVSVETCPVLEAHVLDERAVLPVALMAEWLAHGALHGNPGLVLHGLEDLQVCQGVKLQGNSSVRLQARAGKPRRSEDGYRVRVELGSNGASFGESDGVGTGRRHATAVALLADRWSELDEAALVVPLAPYWREVSEVYEQVLFHGPALQGLTLIEGCSETGIAGRVRTAPLPAAWLRQPLRSTWLMDPLVLDACLQLLSLWSYEQTGAVALPTQIGRLRLFTRSFPAGEVRVAARITQHRPPALRADIDITDPAGHLLARLGDCACVSDPSLNMAFRRNRLTASTC